VLVKTVTLANQTRSIQVMNLPFEIVPELSSRGVAGTQDHDGSTGGRSVRAHRKKISGSITFQPKGTKGDILERLPLSVLDAPDVKRALEAWPPKLAAKLLEPREQEEAEARAVADAKKREEEAAEHRRLLDVKASRRAAMAGAQVEPSVQTTTRKEGRVARPTSKE
jgi:hypothetical protein